MTISENKVLFSELAGCSFFSSTPNIHGGGGDSSAVGNSTFDGYIDKADTADGEITMSGNGEAVIDSLSQNYNRNFNVTKNLFKGSAADLNKYLSGTKMSGQGAALLEAQEKYGVNALFLMAIIETESGYGNAPARDKSGVKPFNVAGLKKRGGGYQNNASYEACIDSLGSNLSRLYFKNGRVTIEKIRQLYCRGNTRWSNKIVGEMKNISSKISQQYGE